MGRMLSPRPSLPADKTARPAEASIAHPADFGDYMHTDDNRTKPKAMNGFGVRLETAATAKKAQLEKWRLNQVDTNDPAFLEREAARKLAAAVRSERDAQRKAEKIAANERAVADRQAAKEAAEAKLIAEQMAASQDAAALDIQHAQRKAARDARYAARKARM